MKIQTIISILAIATVFCFLSCESVNKELKKDAANIADVMCKSLETMNKLKATDPNDSLRVNELQQEIQKIQTEMTRLYDGFNKKYAEQTKKEEFNKEFAKCLRESMLGCTALSKEDRATFEKETVK